MNLPNFTSLPLERDELPTLFDGQFHLHCPEMELFSDGGHRPTISGAGYIQISEEGTINFALYSSQALSGYSLFNRMRVSPGMLIPDEEYYELRATDTRGREWLSHKVRPGINSLNRTVCTGQLHEISCQSRWPETKGESLIGRYFGEIKVPFNETSEARMTWGKNDENSLGGFGSLNLFSTQVADHKILMHSSATLTTLQVDVPKGRLARNIELRLLESLQFTTAKTCVWSVVNYYGNQQCSVVIRSNSTTKIHNRLHPPLSLQINNQIGFETLFKAYLGYIIDYDSDYMHPFSAHLRAISQASSATLEAKSLALSVAVESIAKSLIPETKSLSPKDKRDVKNLVAHVKNSWEGSEELKKRVEGLFGMLHQLSTRQRLEILCEQGVVTIDQISAWKQIRNKVAHGEPIASIPFQQLLNWVNAILVMLYRMIFYEIGYRGGYLDYSEIGFPEKTFTLDDCDQSEL